MKKRLARIATFLVLTGFVFGQAQMTASAAQQPTGNGITPQLRLFLENINYFNINACDPSAGSSDPGTAAPSSANINTDAAKQAAQKASTGSTKVGYAIYDSSGKKVGGYNDTFQNYGASITKSMLLVAYLKQVGSGNLSSTAKSELTSMIEVSDNDAANWTFDHLSNGVADVNKVATSAGMDDFKIDTSDPVYVLGQSKITANDFAKFFAKIDTMFPSAQKNFALNLLSHLASEDQNGLLQAGLPGTVYSKEGWKPEPSGSQGAPYIVNQAAQFSTDSTTYGLAVTVAGTSDQAAGEAIVKDVGSALVSSNGGGGGDKVNGQSPSQNGGGGAQGAGGGGGGPTIVIDPGHSGRDISDTDPQTGLYDHDYPNVPEINEVFTVAQKVQTKLKDDGYNVIMTKKSADDSVSFRDRANMANQANADLALSIHDSHDTSWNDMGDGNGGQVYVQKVGDYRQNKPGEGRGRGKVTFDDADVAKKSQQYGKIFADERGKVEGHKVAVTDISFDSRAGLPSGNLPMVQLFSKVPWIYNEVGAGSGKLTDSQLNDYAKGLINSVEQSVPSDGSGSASSASNTGSPGCCTGSTFGIDASTDGSDSGVWNSGLQPPYIIEQYAIEVLKDLAQKKHVSESDAVTQEHVLALVAWAFIEGGDIMNSSLFNLYNTGYSDPALDSGPHTTNGLGSYKSFDAGVEATSRTIAKGHGGMLKVLMDPNSTAKDFAHAESYTGTDAYPGTLIWSGAGYDNPSGYEHDTWGSMLSSVRSDYKGHAGIVIGTPAFEQQDNKTDTSKVQFGGGGGDTTGGSSGSGGVDCAGSGVTGQGPDAIVQEALNYAWPDYHSAPYFKMKPAYQAAIVKAVANGEYVGGLSHPGIDCGGFVTRVMRDSGADPNYNWGPNSSKQGPTPAQQDYMDAHPEKYKNLGKLNNASSLQPGDIAINSEHTYIYMGKQPNFNGNSASASVSFTGSSWRTPMADNAYFSNSAGAFTWYRLIQ